MQKFRWAKEEKDLDGRLPAHVRGGGRRKLSYATGGPVLREIWAWSLRVQRGFDCVQ